MQVSNKPRKQTHFFIQVTSIHFGILVDGKKVNNTILGCFHRNCHGLFGLK